MLHFRLPTEEEGVWPSYQAFLGLWVHCGSSGNGHGSLAGWQEEPAGSPAHEDMFEFRICNRNSLGGVVPRLIVLIG